MDILINIDELVVDSQRGDQASVAAALGSSAPGILDSAALTEVGRAVENALRSPSVEPAGDESRRG